MDGNSRRATIVEALKGTSKPLSASRLADRFGVSRQIIVGDIALLRAQGNDIFATARGYLFEAPEQKEGVIKKLACNHQPEEAEAELTTIVSLGGEVLNVIVEHPIYGEITGNLHIHTLEDVKKFVSLYKKEKTSLLLELTSGIHLHTIRCQNEKVYATIQQALAKKNLLYNE